MRKAVCGGLIIILLAFLESVHSDDHEDLLSRLDTLEEEIKSLKEQLKTRLGNGNVEQCAYKEYWGSIASNS